MGIKGLWGALKPYVDDGNISQFRGQRVAVDTYVWLHRCLKGNVDLDMDKLLEYFLHLEEVKYKSQNNNSEKNDETEEEEEHCITMEDVLVLKPAYIEGLVRNIDALQRHGVVPVCVFDGAEMPMKGGTDADRGERRRSAFLNVLHLLKEIYQEGRARGPAPSTAAGLAARLRASPTYEKALGEFEKAVNVSTEMAHVVLQVLKEERNVECIVAPYEADAELAYLCREGYVSAVISEDSDLIAYFCPFIISKLQLPGGQCDVLQPPQQVRRFYADCAAASSKKLEAALTAAPSPPSSPAGGVVKGGGAAPSSPTSRSATRFSYESFLMGCILSGCDYVANLSGIGVKRAFAMVSHTTALPQLLRVLEQAYGFSAEELQSYKVKVLHAFYCFMHHIVFCPIKNELVLFHPLPEPSSGAARLRSELVGCLWPRDVAREVCRDCLKDPVSHQLYQGVHQQSLQKYLQRARRGQTSLRATPGFHLMQTPRVVLPTPRSTASVRAKEGEEKGKAPRPSAAWCVRGGVVDEESGFFGAAPLRRQRVVHGFLGSMGSGATRPRQPPHGEAMEWSGSTASGSSQEKTETTTETGMSVVRSKYFLQASSLDEEDSEETEEENDHHSPPNNKNNKNNNTTSHLAMARTGSTTSLGAAGQPLAGDSPPEGATSPLPSSCSSSSSRHGGCALGCNQCHRAHSVFEPCVVAKPRPGEAPTMRPEFGEETTNTALPSSSSSSFLLLASSLTHSFSPLSSLHPQKKINNNNNKTRREEEEENEHSNNNNNNNEHKNAEQKEEGVATMSATSLFAKMAYQPRPFKAPRTTGSSEK